MRFFFFVFSALCWCYSCCFLFVRSDFVRFFSLFRKIPKRYVSWRWICSAFLYIRFSSVRFFFKINELLQLDQHWIEKCWTQNQVEKEYFRAVSWIFCLKLETGAPPFFWMKISIFFKLNCIDSQNIPILPVHLKCKKH